MQSLVLFLCFQPFFSIRFDRFCKIIKTFELREKYFEKVVGRNGLKIECRLCKGKLFGRGLEAKTFHVSQNHAYVFFFPDYFLKLTLRKCKRDDGTFECKTCEFVCDNGDVMKDHLNSKFGYDQEEFIEEPILIFNALLIKNDFLSRKKDYSSSKRLLRN